MGTLMTKVAKNKEKEKIKMIKTKNRGMRIVIQKKTVIRKQEIKDHKFRM